MKFLHTFESYLVGARQPLYHFTFNLKSILKTNTIIAQKGFYPDRTKKAICLTRFKGYSGASGNERICLDTNLLIKHGYKPYPIDEYGHAFNFYVKKHINSEVEKNKKKVYHFKTISKPFTQGEKTVHGIPKFENPMIKIPLEIEYEERIYKNIENVGKYILYIDVDENFFDSEKEILIEYVKKYPHILVRKLKYKITNLGKSPMLDPTEILLSIDKI